VPACSSVPPVLGHGPPGNSGRHVGRASPSCCVASIWSLDLPDYLMPKITGSVHGVEPGQLGPWLLIVTLLMHIEPSYLAPRCSWVASPELLHSPIDVHGSVNLFLIYPELASARACKLQFCMLQNQWNLANHRAQRNLDRSVARFLFLFECSRTKPC
jgi:hypothetical protein